MLGAICGDIIGSVYEFNRWNGSKNDFPLFTPKSTFTDDTVMTIALSQALMKGNGNDAVLKETIIDNFHLYGCMYAKAGYGARFAKWIYRKERKPYNSFGNGSAMRVSPVGWAFSNLNEVEKYAKMSAEVTHNHPEGIKGACAVADCIVLAREGKSKTQIKNLIASKHGYNLYRKLDDIQKNYAFNETCQGSVPEAIISFLESDDFESAIRNAVWLGGDADTQAAIAGSIAEAFYGGVPEYIAEEAINRLDFVLYENYFEWADFVK